MAEWWFTECPVNIKCREPMQEEYFSNNTHIQSLVREAIQNSLDAGKDSDGPVKVRIFRSGKEKSISPDNYLPFWNNAVLHYNATGYCLGTGTDLKQYCDFLAIEDFNTPGLRGDVEGDDAGNSYYNFFQAEGHSEKLAGNIGRWGVGKFVFPMSSKIRTFFAFTIRDHERLLAGQSILETHRVNGKKYTPDGWFGEKHPHTGVNLPVCDSSYIDSFAQTFSLSRREESGLSVVIPFIAQQFSWMDLVDAVVKNFFYAIIKKKLVVILESGNTDEANMEIRSDTIHCIAEQFLADSETAELINMAVWASALSEDSFFVLGKSTDSNCLRWTDDMIPDPQKQVMSEKLDKGERIAVKVPMFIREREQEIQSDTYDIIIEKIAPGTPQRPFFVRNGILIAEVRSEPAIIRGYRTLYLIADSKVEDMLGVAETPSHCSWSHNTKGFEKKYIYPKMHIQFILRSVHEILTRVNAGDTEFDYKLLTKYFSLPKDLAKDKEPKPKAQNPKDGSNPPEPDIPKGLIRPPSRFTLNKLKNGFSVTGGNREFEKQFVLDIHLAYDRMQGSPKYDTNDFQVQKKPIEVTYDSGVIIKTRQDNYISCIINRKDFKLSVIGFDINRDLDIRIRTRGEEE